MTMIITWLSTHRPFQKKWGNGKNNFIKGRRRKDQSVAGTQAGRQSDVPVCISSPAFTLFLVCGDRHNGLAVESLTFACRVSGTRKSCSSKELEGRGLCWDSNGLASMAWALSHYPLWEWVVSWGRHVILSLSKQTKPFHCDVCCFHMTLKRGHLEQWQQSIAVPCWLCYIKREKGEFVKKDAN